MNRKVELQTTFDEMVFPFSHDFTSPWSYASFVKTELRIWYDQIWINSQGRAKSITCFTCTIRIIKTEKIFCGDIKFYPIKFKSIVEYLSFIVFVVVQRTFSSPFPEGCFYAIKQAIVRLFFRFIDFNSINNDLYFGFVLDIFTNEGFNLLHFPINEDPNKTFL